MAMGKPEMPQTRSFLNDYCHGIPDTERRDDWHINLKYFIRETYFLDGSLSDWCSLHYKSSLSSIRPVFPISKPQCGISWVRNFAVSRLYFDFLKYSVASHATTWPRKRTRRARKRI